VPGVQDVSSGTWARRVVNDSYMASGPAGEVGPPAPVQEQGVAGDETTVDEEALAAGRVARCVDQGDGISPTMTTSPP